MSTQLKTAITPDVTDIVDGQTIDAADVTQAISDIQTQLRNGQAAVSAGDLYVGHLEDKIVGVANNTSVTKVDTGANETLAINLNATGVTNGYVPTANGSNGWSWAAQAGGGATPIDITVTAGETLAERDAVYLQLNSITAYKIDADDATPKLGMIRGIVNESGGISAAATGSVRIQGEVSGFTGLSAGGEVYASSTAGGITQTKPSPTDGGAQVAVVRIGFATSTTAVMVWPGKVQYLKRATMADDGTLTVAHHYDDLGRNREPKAYMSTTVAGSTLATYASGNQDSDVTLKAQTPATYGSDQCTGGTAIGSMASPANAFDDNNTSAAGDSNTTGTLGYDFGAANDKTIRRYTIRCHSTSPVTTAPNSWTFEYSTNGSDWTVVDTVSGSSGWSLGETRTFDVDGVYSARYWRANITANNGGGFMLISEMQMLEAATYNDGDTILAQSFQVTGSQDVDTVKLWLKKVGAPTGNLTVKIQTDNTGEPSGTEVTNGTSDTVAASTLSTSYGWIEFTFSTNPSLSGSTTYWIVLETADAQSPSDYVVWGADGSAPSYANGEMLSYDGATWNTESKDAVFEALGPGASYEEPCAIQRWSMADTLDIAVRYDDGSGNNRPTNTTFKNVTGAAKDITVVVELE